MKSSLPKWIFWDYETSSYLNFVCSNIFAFVYFCLSLVCIFLFLCIICCIWLLDFNATMQLLPGGYIALLYLITFDKIPIISLSFTCFRVNIQWKWKMLDIEQWTMDKEEYSIFMVIVSKTADNNKVVLFNVFIETTIQSTTKCFHSLTKPVSTSGQGFVKNSFWISH